MSETAMHSLMDFIERLWPSNVDSLTGWDAGLGKTYKAIGITGMSSDSRSIQTGDLFVALPGIQVDGMTFASQAINAGAAAVFCEAGPESADPVFDSLDGCPLIRVNHLTKRLSGLAGWYFGNPSRSMSVTGVTGTNGKTSISWMLAGLLAEFEGCAGVVGTLGYGAIKPSRQDKNAYLDGGGAPGWLHKTGYTTPDAIATQECLADLGQQGCQSVVMEVSSHALVQQRVEAVEFSIAVFSNLSRDHLDYHESMAAYFSAKRRLFEFDSVTHAVINLDDRYAQKLLPEIAEGLHILTYSTSDPSASVYAKNIVFGVNGFSADICFGGQALSLQSNLLGEFNVSNSLAVIAVLLVKGFELSRILQALSAAPALPGRMQRVVVSASQMHSEAGETQAVVQDIEVIVDYAHTPDALQRVLAALRRHTLGRLICVFGCGGNRDVGKRPLMGAAAEQGADRLYITSDNPRDEDPQLIVDDICRGLSVRNSVVVEINREAAIARAISEAETGAVVLIAGKGHECEQLIGGKRVPFSDYEIAQRELLRRIAA